VRALAHDLAGGIAPTQAALGDLVQRRRALGGELPEYLPSLLSDLACDPRALAGHPARHRDRRDGADAREALLDRRVQLKARVLRACEHRVDHVLDPVVQRVSESTEVVAVGDRR
jgi:hypothetical protein